MPIDPSISLRVRPVEFENPLNQYANFMQIQAAQRQGALDEQKMRDMEEQRQSQTAINEIYKRAVKPDGSVDRSVMTNALAGGGFGSRIPSMQKEWAAVDKDLADVESKKATASKSAFDLAKQRFDIYKSTAGRLRGVPNLSREMVLGEVGQLVNANVLPMETAQALAQSLPEDPRELAAVVDRAFRSQMTEEQILQAFSPKPTQVDNGQQIGFRDTNPNSPTYGQSTAGGAVQKVADPNAVLSATTSEANNRRSVGASMANAAAIRSTGEAAKEAARIAANAKNETDIRKEFADLPEVKKLKNAIPAYNSIISAAKINNPQADINLIYGIAKLYDPDSVVREGEYATIANSQAIPDWVKGQAQRLAGGGRLTENTKAQLVEQANIRLQSYKGEFDASRGAFEEIVKKRGLDPSNVLTPVGGSIAKPPPPKDTPQRQSGAISDPNIRAQADAILRGK